MHKPNTLGDAMEIKTKILEQIHSNYRFDYEVMLSGTVKVVTLLLTPASVAHESQVKSSYLYFSRVAPSALGWYQ